MSGATETTALLAPTSPSLSTKRSFFPTVHRVLLTSFLLATTFAFTATSLIYSFRTMTCDEYYKHHSSAGAMSADRCSVPRIEADSAKQIAIMSSTTTACTIVNLFFTGWWIKRYGVKAAMFQQTIWSTMRNVCQIYALSHGGILGIRVIQVTQLFNLFGSAGGYQLAANAYIAKLASDEKRTSMFGILGGIIMLGSSAGNTFGGVSEYFFGPLAPFQIAFCLLVLSTFFGSVFLPYMAPDHLEENAGGDQKGPQRSKSFLAPLKVFIPRPRRTADGTIKGRDWNVTLLGMGAFLSVLATGYIGLCLQLVGINVYGFKPVQSGFMLSLVLLMKAFFLSICFPRIISSGRRWLSSRQGLASPQLLQKSFSPDDRPDSPVQAEEPDPASGPRQDLAQPPTDRAHGSEFDLYFLRWSIFTDSVLTACVYNANQGWHMYIAAVILPFACGTGAASKGVMLDFVKPDEHSDALSAIAMVEKLAMVMTGAFFGFIFSLLSEIGRPNMIFLAMATIAIFAFLLLLFVRMPREGQIALA